MAQSGFTPLLIYSSSTTSNAPSAGNLTNSALGSELAINIADGKLFYKDSGNNVQVIAWKTTPTIAGGTGLTSYTAGDLLYYATGTTLTALAIGASGRYLSSTGSAPQWSAPAALTKTDDTNVTLTLGGSASTALLNAASLTLGWTGQLAVTRGGTGLATVAQGDILYGSAANTLSALAKNTTATRYLANTGTNNNPAWAQIDLTNGVTGTMPTGNGGTGVASYTAGDLLYYASGTALTKLGIGAANTVLTSSGTAPQWSTSLSLTGLTVTNGSSDTNVSVNSNAGAISAVGRYSTDTIGPQLVLRKYRGTIASPTTDASGDTLGQLLYQGYDGTNTLSLANVSGVLETLTATNNASGQLQFLVRPTGVGATLSEAMRIWASRGISIGNTTDPGLSNVTIGALGGTSTATPNYLGLGGTYSNTAGANPKMRVYWDGSASYGFGVSAGQLDYIVPSASHHYFYEGSNFIGGFNGVDQLVVGTTDQSAKFQSYISTNGVSARIAAGLSTGQTNDIFQVTALNHASGTGYYFARFYSSGPTVQFAVRGDGTVYAQNTTIQSLSDIRTKENVRESEDGLDVIMALRPVRFDFKKGFGNERKDVLGFIAQEVEPVFPDAVDVVNDPDGEGPEEPYKSVGPSALIPVLVKAIQELNDKLKAANVAGF